MRGQGQSGNGPGPYICGAGAARGPRTQDCGRGQVLCERLRRLSSTRLKHRGPSTWSTTLLQTLLVQGVNGLAHLVAGTLSSFSPFYFPHQIFCSRVSGQFIVMYLYSFMYLFLSDRNTVSSNK